MRRNIVQALLALSLLVLVGCDSIKSGNLAPPLVFPTTVPTVAGPPGPPPLGIYLSSANFQGNTRNFVLALDAASGKLRWRDDARAQVENPVKLYQNVAYIGESDHKLYALNAGNGSLRWSYDLGSGIPAVAATDNGVVYAFSYQNSSQSAPFSLYALNASDGSLRWRSPIQGYIQRILDDVIYLTASDGIYALKADDGSVKWHFQMQQAAISAVQESMVYAAAADQHVYALNASDGSVRWKFQAAYPPMVQQIADGTVYLLASPEGPNGSGPNSILYALNASSGALQWQYPNGNDLENVQWIGAANGVAYLLTSINEQFHLPRLVLALKASTGAVKWRYQLDSQTASIQAAMLDNGLVYLENSDGTLDALNASDGAVRWQTQVGNITPFIDLIDNGVIYTVLASGSITAVIASNGTILWHYQPGTTVEVLQASSGLLYLYTPPFGGPEVSNYVYALKVSDGTLFWRYDAGSTPFFAVIA